MFPKKKKRREPKAKMGAVRVKSIDYRKKKRRAVMEPLHAPQDAPE